jgi:hypothetical protein
LQVKSSAYTPATRFLYSLSAASSRWCAVVSPGTLCDGWMCSFTPRATSSSAAVVMVIHTTATKAIVDTGPTLSTCPASGTDESPAGTRVSITTSAMSNSRFPDGWRGTLAAAYSAEPVAITRIPSSFARNATSMLTLLIPVCEKIHIVSRRSKS